MPTENLLCAKGKHTQLIPKYFFKVQILMVTEFKQEEKALPHPGPGVQHLPRPIRAAYWQEHNQNGICATAWVSNMGKNDPTSSLWDSFSFLPLLPSLVYVFSCSVVSSDLWPPWTVAHQAPLPMEFSRQEYWRGLPFPLPGDPPNPGIEPVTLRSSALAGRFFTTIKDT